MTIENFNWQKYKGGPPWPMPEEGEICHHCTLDAPGHYEWTQETCECFAMKMPPCHYCENAWLECDQCGHRPDEDENYTHDYDNQQRTKDVEQQQKDNEVLTLLHIEQGAGTVEIKFGPEQPKRYTYLVPRHVHERVHVGDYLLVRPTEGNFGTLVQVTKVHDTPNIAWGQGVVYKWATPTDNPSFLDQIEEQNQVVIENMRRAEARKKIEEAVGELKLPDLAGERTNVAKLMNPDLAPDEVVEGGQAHGEVHPNNKR